MEKVLWLLGGFLHTLFHPDSAFFGTLKSAGYTLLECTFFIVLFSSLGILGLFCLNWLGIHFSSRLSPKFVFKVRRFCAKLVGRFGYFGIMGLCLIPWVPYLKEAALLAGQVLEFKYTLPIVLIFNALRVFALFKIIF